MGVKGDSQPSVGKTPQREQGTNNVHTKITSPFCQLSSYTTTLMSAMKLVIVMSIWWHLVPGSHFSPAPFGTVNVRSQ